MDQLTGEAQVVFEKVRSQLTIQSLVRYIVEGVAVAIAAYVIPNRRTKFNEVAAISLVAALSLFILDVFSGMVGQGTRLGAGFGIGMNLVNSAPVVLPFL